MTKESQAKIEEIAQQKEAAPVAVNVTERAKLERQRHKLERLTQVMISVKAGVQHLAERLDGVKVDAPPPVAVGDASLVPVLQRCEAQLRVVLEAIRQEEEVVEREALKKQCGTILDRATKGRKKKRGGKKEAS